MGEEGKGRLGAFTIIQNEPVFFPIWLRHYARHVGAENLWVLDHRSRGRGKEVLTELQRQHGFQVIELDYEVSFDHRWLRDVVNHFQVRMLERYDWVLFTEADELVLPRPSLGITLREYVERPLPYAVRCTGYEIVHQRDREPPLRFDADSLLAQRRYWYPSVNYSKPLLARVPIQWRGCFHDAWMAPREADPDLLLLHIHKIDFDYALERHIETAARNWTDSERQSGIATHNHAITDAGALADWFARNTDDGSPGVALREIPDDIRCAV